MAEDEQISRGIEFQMTGAAERKEREPTLVLDGVGTKMFWSEWRRQRLMIMNVRRKILRSVSYRGLYMLWLET